MTLPRYPLCRPDWQELIAWGEALHARGVLTSKTTDLCYRSIFRGRPVRFANEDCSASSEIVNIDAKTVTLLNTINAYVEPNLWTCYEVIEELLEPVTKALGSPWTVLNLRAWSTGPIPIPSGPAAWHRDGLHVGVLKIMLYLTSPNKALGGLELRIGDGGIKLEGPAGTWILFDPSAVSHRAVPPTNKSRRRVCLEITLCSTLTYDLTLKYLGTNGRYPKMDGMK